MSSQGRSFIETVHDSTVALLRSSILIPSWVWIMSLVVYEATYMDPFNSVFSRDVVAFWILLAWTYTFVFELHFLDRFRLASLAALPAFYCYLNLKCIVADVGASTWIYQLHKVYGDALGLSFNDFIHYIVSPVAAFGTFGALLFHFRILFKLLYTVYETRAFLVDVKEFVSSRVTRGRHYMTSLFGTDTAVVLGAKAMHIYEDAGRGVVSNDWPDFAKIFFENTLIRAKGDRHLYLRRVFVQLLNTARRATHLTKPMIDESVEYMYARGNLDVAHASRVLATKILLSLLTGDTSDYEQISEHVDAILLGATRLPINLPGTAHYKARQAIKAIDKWIVDKIAAFKERDNQDEEREKSLLGACIFGDDRLSEDEIKALWRTLLLAGIDTVAVTMTFIFIELADNPVLAKILASDTTDKILNTVREVLRLHPPASVLMKTATKPITFIGKTVRAGERFMLDILSTQTHPSVSVLGGPAGMFQPLRTVPKDAFFAFGGGDRVCPGQTWALTELAMFTQSLVRRGYWKLNASPVVRHGLIPSFPNGVYCTMLRAEQDFDAAV